MRHDKSFFSVLDAVQVNISEITLNGTQNHL